MPQTVSAVCRSINKNKKTHSSKDKSTGRYKSPDSLQTLRRTYHERDAELAQGDHTEVWVEEVWPPSSPDCNPFDYLVWGVSVLSVIAEFRVGKRSNQRCAWTLANRSNARHRSNIRTPPYAPFHQMYVSKVWESVWPEGQEAIHS